MPRPPVPSTRRRRAWPFHVGAAVARGLLGLMLVLQLAGVHGLAHAAPTNPDLAGLSAALGQPVALCQHGDVPAAPGAPDECCPACSLCHTPAGLAILPLDLAILAPAPFGAPIVRPRAAQAAPGHRAASGPSPRGPPLSV